MNSKNIFMFEGQGTFKAGFGKQYMNNEVFSQTINQISEITKYDIADLSWGKSAIKTPNNNVNLQLSIFAINLALANMIEAKGIHPQYVLGHSLGEVCALIFSKAINLQDGCKLILKRGEVMQEAGALEEQGMLSITIGVDSEYTSLLEKNQCTLSNINSKNQIVASGLLNNLNQLKHDLKQNNIKSTLLKTNVACHNQLLKDAEQELAKLIDSIEFSNQSDITFIPVNTMKPLTNPSDIQFNLKIHMTAQVNWKRNMHYMHTHYPEYDYIEIGAGNILKGFYLQDKLDLSIKTTRDIT